MTDYKSHLDGVKKIQEVLEESIEIEFQSMIKGDTTPREYVSATEATSSQVTAQISEFVKSKPPEEWQESYITYMEALKTFNLYVIETRIVANAITEGSDTLEQDIQEANTLKQEYQKLIEKSDQTRP